MNLSGFKSQLVTQVIPACLVFCLCHLCACTDFDRKTTGVLFSPFVKRSENGMPIPGLTTYSLDNVKTMLEVVSGRFSRLTTYTVGAPNVEYEPNVTYHNSDAAVYAAEAAALINQQRKELSLTMHIGVYIYDVPLLSQTEIQVALECAQKANAIYMGTVQGLIFYPTDSYNGKSVPLTLELMRATRADANRLNLTLGSRQPCRDLLSDDNSNNVSSLIHIRKSIVNESDVILCPVYPQSSSGSDWSENGFRWLIDNLAKFQSKFREINPNVEVFGNTGWHTKGANVWENYNLRNYWAIVNKLASRHNFTIFLSEAIDDPSRGAKYAHMGWWRLRENSQINSTEGYYEKINDDDRAMTTSTTGKPEKESHEGSTASLWIYVGVVISAFAVFFIITGMILMFVKIYTMQEVSLTKDEVAEFIRGTPEELALVQGAEVESALQMPYDKSYEILRDKLKILKDSVLGTGNFGCVYKALLIREECSSTVTEVAVKMAKRDCPRTALKGLLSEIKILTYLGKHPYIVSIHGAYTAEILNGVVYIATELCSLGSLQSYLRKGQMNDETTHSYANSTLFQITEKRISDDIELNKHHDTEPSKRPDISVKDMLRWSHEIACGMEYLGTRNVVHADLAARNVLLTFNKTAKITDFGLSRKLYDSEYVKKQQEPLPWRWMAIESLKRMEFSPKSDIWSYGVTLWEIFAKGDLPYPGLSGTLEFVDNLVSGLRMNSPPHASPEIYKVMVDCWNLEPNERPSFRDLKLITEDLTSSFTVTVTV